MRIDWDVAVAMDDGASVHCDVFRPVKEGRYPVILSYGPYGKDLAFQDGYPDAWERMAEKHPDVAAGSSNRFQSWEVCDPEKWVPDGYVCVRVDARGWGRSPGYIDPWSAARDQGPARLHRVGGHPAVEQRQGRPARHQLLRRQPMAGRRAEVPRIWPR